METLLVFAQSGGLTGSLLWPFLIIVALAIIIWLLSWLLFPDPTPKPTHRTLHGLTGLDDVMSAKLQRFGIFSDKDLMRLSPRGQQELESQLGLHNGEYPRWRQEIMHRWRESYLPPQLRGIAHIFPDPELGGLYSKKPERIDDLAQVAGIDRLTANRMNAAGIYTFEQLRLLTPEQQANLKNRFSLSGFRFGAVPTQGNPIPRADVASGVSAAASDTRLDSKTSPNAGTSSAGTRTASHTPAGIPKSKIDPDLGRVYSAPPPHRDDLTRLPGIDISAARKLNEAGVYTTDQLLSLTPTQQASFKQRFNLPTIDFHKWKQAVGLSNSAISSGSSNVEVATKQLQPDKAATQRASQSLPSSLQAKTTPQGGSPAAASASLTTSEAGKELRVDGPQGLNDIGYVYVTAPRDPDDLTKLDGVSTDVAKRMNTAGIYKFNQLRTMSVPQRESFLKRFQLPSNVFSTWSASLGSASTASNISKVTATTPNVASASLADTASFNVPNSSAGTTSTPNMASPTTSLSADNRPIGFATGGSQKSRGASDGASSIGSPATNSPYGLVFSSRPDHVDDLTKLQGIDTATATKLNAAGIYTYDQLRGLDSQQLAKLSSDFNLDSAHYADWRRCIHAWSRGIDTTADVPRTYRTGWLHGVRLPEIAKGVFDGKQLVAYPEQVVFRGSNPDKWGQAIVRGDEGVDRSLAAGDVRSDINYVRIRRVDTRDSVVSPITKGQLFSPGPPEGNGWNGLCESFFGGRHLGVYANDIPNEMETRFGLGGWGFGHRFDHNDQQEWGWAGRVIEPTTFEISVGRIGSPSGTVVFRANDPTIWNQRVKEGNDRFAMPIDAVTHPVSYLRMLRVDTGEAVVVRIDRGGLLRRGENPRLGWNGLCDEFSGGHHLGIYYREAPQSVEICFGEGGWGFGHPYGDNDRQAFGWGGHAIGGPTTFEVSLLEHLPDYLRHELLE